MSKGNSRPITINGEGYRWSFFQNSGWDDVIIQHDSGRGQKLAVQIEQPMREVTPSFVAQSIAFALGAGWKANESGPPFNLRYHDQAFTVR